MAEMNSARSGARMASSKVRVSGSEEEAAKAKERSMMGKGGSRELSMADAGGSWWVQEGWRSSAGGVTEGVKVARKAV